MNGTEALPGKFKHQNGCSVMRQSLLSTKEGRT